MTKGNKKKTANIIIDLSMVVLMPLLMAYSLIGEEFHEIIGTLIFILFIVHHILHLKWWKAIPRGKYNAYRISITVFNIILLIVMFLQPLSGIALMNLSSVYARAALNQKVQAAVAVDFVPTLSSDALHAALTDIVRRRQRETCEDLLSGLLVKKLGIALLKRVGVRPDAPTASLTGSQIDALCKACKHCVFSVTGSGPLRDAQVTVGGLAQSGFDPATLESRTYENLYAIGEVLDVDGPCGGFNLQWAFASARLCAADIAERKL